MKSMPAMSRPTTIAACRAICVVGMDVVRSVDRRAAGAHVAGLLEHDHLLVRRGRLASRCPAAGAFPSSGSSIEIRVRIFSWPTPRRGSVFVISISSRDRVFPVPNDMGRDALGDRHDLAIDDEDPVVAYR